MAATAPDWCANGATSMSSEREARRLIDGMTTALLQFSSEGRLVDINASGEALLALSARRAYGQTVEALFPRNSEFARVVRRTIASRHAFSGRGLHIVTAMHHNGTSVDFSVTPLAGDSASADVIVELTSLEQQHRIAREEDMLIQQNVTRALVLGMAHEIKNPLGGIRGAAQLLERELGDRQEREYTRIIMDEVDRLRTLIDRMLEPQQRPILDTINVHEVLEHVRAVVQAQEIDTPVRQDYDPSIPLIRADRDHLIQVFMNLVRNAVEAAKTGVCVRTRAEHQVTIGGIQHRLVVRVDIIDDGPGVPAEIRDAIFYPMVTGRENGTGLGLPIAQSLVQKHGGLISCDSEPGDTVFTVWLPFLEADSESKH